MQMYVPTKHQSTSRSLAQGFLPSRAGKYAQSPQRPYQRGTHPFPIADPNRRPVHQI